MNKGLPAIKRTVHAEEFKWVLALWALRGLLVGCPPQNARHAVGVVASLDKGRLLERDLIEANRADPAIHHPVAAAAAPGARSRRLVEGEGVGRADESLGGG